MALNGYDVNIRLLKLTSYMSLFITEADQQQMFRLIKILLKVSFNCKTRTDRV